MKHESVLHPFCPSESFTAQWIYDWLKERQSDPERYELRDDFIDNYEEWLKAYLARHWQFNLSSDDDLIFIKSMINKLNQSELQASYKNYMLGYHYNASFEVTVFRKFMRDNTHEYFNRKNELISLDKKLDKWRSKMYWSESKRNLISHRYKMEKIKKRLQGKIKLKTISKLIAINSFSKFTKKS
jgi:hypothetical protein